MDTKVGCCGFPVAKGRYFETFSAVESQQTFYQLPMVKTALKWRDEAPEGFEFTMKASQLVTHEPSSPTYRRYKRPIPKDRGDNYGFFRGTEEVMGAWKSTREIAESLQAKVMVFQCPPSFTPSQRTR